MGNLEQLLVKATNKFFDKVEEIYSQVEAVAEIGIEAVVKAYDKYKPRVIKSLKWILITDGILVILSLVSFLCNLPLLGTLTGTFAAILTLLLWLAPTILVNVISGTLNNIPYVQKLTVPLTDGLKSLLRPVLSTSLIISFVCTLGTVYMMRGYTIALLIGAFGGTMFCIIYALTKKNFSFPWRGIMATIIIVGLFYRGASFAAPRPMADFDDTIRIFVDNSFTGEERILMAGSYLYDQDYNILDSVQVNTVVKVLGSWTVEDIDEQLYKVAMPRSGGQYSKNDIKYVAQRRTVRGNGNIQIVNDPKQPEVKNVSQQVPVSTDSYDQYTNVTEYNKPYHFKVKKGREVRTGLEPNLGDKINYTQVTTPIRIMYYDGNGNEQYAFITKPMPKTALAGGSEIKFTPEDDGDITIVLKK